MRGQALLIELQNSEQQGISIWLGRSGDGLQQETGVMAVRDEISYMGERHQQSDEQQPVRLDSILSS